MNSIISPAQRFRQAILAPTSSLNHLQRLGNKLESIRNVDPSTRQTSLHLAGIAGRTDIAEWLIIDEGIDEEEISRDSTGDTLLHVAASKGHIEIIELYLSQYSFVLDWVNSWGATALHVAAQFGEFDVAQLLIDFGADVDAPDLEGNSPLHYASSWGNLTVVRLLIELGCQHSVKNNEGFTALEYAYSFAVMNSMLDFARIHSETSKRLKRRGTQDNSNSTPKLRLLTQDPFAPAAPPIYDDPPTPTGSPELVFRPSVVPPQPFRSVSKSNQLAFDYSLEQDSPQLSVRGTVSSLTPTIDNKPTTTTTNDEGSPLARRRAARSPSVLSSGVTSSIDSESLRAPSSSHIGVGTGMAGGAEVRMMKARHNSFSSLKPTPRTTMTMTRGERSGSIQSSQSSLSNTNHNGNNPTQHQSSSSRSRAGSTSVIPSTGLFKSTLPPIIIESSPTLPPPPPPPKSNEVTGNNNSTAMARKASELSVEETRVRRGSEGRLAGMKSVLGFGRKKSTSSSQRE